MNKTILYHSNILTKKDVPFLNFLGGELSKSSIQLILTGWNHVLSDWQLEIPYYSLPRHLNYFKVTYSRDIIEEDFEKYNLCIRKLLNRFDWWFEKSSSEIDNNQRIAFLHYHLTHYSKLIKLHKPSLFLIWNGFDPRHLILSALCDHYNIGKIYLERGPLPGINFYDNLGVLCSSSIYKKKIDYKSINSQRRYNYFKWYNNNNETLWEQPNKKSDDIRKKYRIASSLKVTLFVGQVDNDVQTQQFSPHFSSNLDAFSFFLKHVRRDNHFILGKHHPKSKIDVNSYRDLIREEKNAVWSDELNLYDCLEVADNVVAVNSSVIFDALIYKKPVLALGETILHGQNIIYEYMSGDDNIVESFYSNTNLAQKLNRFDLFFEYLLINHLIFIEEQDSAFNFSKYLIDIIEEVNITSENILNEDVVLQNYNSNVNLILYKKELKFNQKLKADIKWYFKKFKKKLNG